MMMRTGKSGGAMADELQMPLSNLERKNDLDSTAKDRFAAACIKAMGPCFGISLDIEMDYFLTALRK